MTTATATTTWETALDSWMGSRGYTVRERFMAIEFGRKWGSLRFCPALEEADFEQARRIHLYGSLD